MAAAGTGWALSDLMQMNGRELFALMQQGHPLDPDALAGRQYLGVDLSLADWARKLLWHTFRKTFVLDPDTGVVRGWNVRMEQRGIDGPRIPLRTRHGLEMTFGHYQVRSAVGMAFPKRWQGAHYLDYRQAGNGLVDPARWACTPLVAVNPPAPDQNVNLRGGVSPAERGDRHQELLLGWEVFRIGPMYVYPPLFWALQYEGPLERVVSPPRLPAVRQLK